LSFLPGIKTLPPGFLRNGRFRIIIVTMKTTMNKLFFKLLMILLEAVACRQHSGGEDRTG